MYSVKAFFITFCIVCFSSSQTSANPSSQLLISLEQTVDIQCDGGIDSPYSINNALLVLPHQCIMYKVSTKNISTTTLHELVIKGNIPAYTKLVSGLIFVYKQDELQQNHTVQVTDSAEINTRLTKLKSLETATLFYSVRVE